MHNGVPVVTIYVRALALDVLGDLVTFIQEVVDLPEAGVQRIVYLGGLGALRVPVNLIQAVPLLPSDEESMWVRCENTIIKG
mgnify:CR=1 FL=1